jgi:hypothetical protein
MAVLKWESSKQTPNSSAIFICDVGASHVIDITGNEMGMQAFQNS